VTIGEEEPDRFPVRRVVLTVDQHGHPRVTDGPPLNSVHAPTGFGCAELWTLRAPPASARDGFDPPRGPFALEPKAGGLTWRIIRLPVPDAALPREEQFLHIASDERFSDEKLGMHRTDTVDFEVILDGEIELEVESGCVRLGPGDVVVQRGTRHRWRVVGKKACTYSAIMLGTEGGDPCAFDLAPRSGSGTHVRRVVTGLDGQGRSIVATDGPPPCHVRGDETVTHLLYETGGALSSPLQGGDTFTNDVAVAPIGRGVSWRLLEITQGANIVQAGGTLDLVVVLQGDAVLEFGGGQPLQLRPNDCLVNQGLEVAWRATNVSPVHLATALIAARA
jgi:mannose-6-phosphate isomerase-like protein (cupin superfamily)